MRKFDIPIFYRSSIISSIKNSRKNSDPRRKDLEPSVLDFGPVRFKIARHFGFCFGVENAIEIAYKAIDENPNKRIFLLSEIIHNPHVNIDLANRGIKFIMSDDGKQIISWDELTSDDVVIVPAFGTTLEIQEQLTRIGIDPYKHDSTCPFVEKVWNRTESLGETDFTVVIHGKRKHEETRATFSHSSQNAKTIIVQTMQETQILSGLITGAIPIEEFDHYFSKQVSDNFNPLTDLMKIGVVNQTTMLASETQSIAEVLKKAMINKFGLENIKDHFGDTKDTLCYATNENQNATKTLIENGGNLAIVVGGYNSSNTSHLVELCESKISTFFIKDCEEVISETEINHFSLNLNKVVLTKNWLPKVKHDITEIIITSGASCPDALVDEVILKIVSFYPNSKSIDEALIPFMQ